MATTVIESPDSRSATAGKSQRRIYIIRGTADQADALTNLANETPTTADGLVRRERSVSPVYIDSTRSDDCIWQGEVLYVSSSYSQAATPLATGESSFSFGTGGGMQHITQALATTAYGTNAPNVQKAIGATADGVAGTDIHVPVYQFNETHYIPDANVDDAYKGKLFTLTGKTNSGVFRGFQVGECLFLGASGSRRGSGADWEIAFSFAASPNKTNLTIGSITGINKKGFEILDVFYEPVEVSGANIVLSLPKYVHVHAVYEAGNFADLGIGI
jgi:hypothetical protein